MAVRLRLTRIGGRKNPIWRVVVADQRSKRDGRVIETVGHYNAQTDPSTIVLNEERIRDWLARGAQPSGHGPQAPAHAGHLASRGVASCKELLEYLARGLVDQPDAVEVTEIEEDDGTIVLELSVAPGRLRQRDRPWRPHRRRRCARSSRPPRSRTAPRVRRHRRRLGPTDVPERRAGCGPGASAVPTASTAASTSVDADRPAARARRDGPGRRAPADGSPAGPATTRGRSSAWRAARTATRAEALRGSELLVARDAAPAARARTSGGPRSSRAVPSATASAGRDGRRGCSRCRPARCWRSAPRPTARADAARAAGHATPCASVDIDARG